MGQSSHFHLIDFPGRDGVSVLPLQLCGCTCYLPVRVTEGSGAGSRRAIWDLENAIRFLSTVQNGPHILSRSRFHSLCFIPSSLQLFSFSISLACPFTLPLSLSLFPALEEELIAWLKWYVFEKLAWTVSQNPFDKRAVEHIC